MIARVIEWSARNLVLVFFATALITARSAAKASWYGTTISLLFTRIVGISTSDPP